MSLKIGKRTICALISLFENNIIQRQYGSYCNVTKERRPEYDICRIYPGKR